MLDILENLEQYNEKQATQILLDTEKAFDILNWALLLKVLEDVNLELDKTQTL